MTQSQPPITRTTRTLPFDKLSPPDFERLCLWLVEREGYERAEHLGAAGSDQGGASSPIGPHPAATNYRALLCGDPERACNRLKRRFETLTQRAERLLEEITSRDPLEWGIGFAA